MGSPNHGPISKNSHLRPNNQLSSHRFLVVEERAELTGFSETVGGLLQYVTIQEVQVYPWWQEIFLYGQMSRWQDS